MNQTTLWYVAAVLFFVAAAASFIAGSVAIGAAMVVLAIVCGLIAQRQSSARTP